MLACIQKEKQRAFRMAINGRTQEDTAKCYCARITHTLLKNFQPAFSGSTASANQGARCAQTFLVPFDIHNVCSYPFHRADTPNEMSTSTDLQRHSLLHTKRLSMVKWIELTMTNHTLICLAKSFWLTVQLPDQKGI